eukprot:303980-Chlamydomonas_euryale.AAC.12
MDFKRFMQGPGPRPPAVETQEPGMNGRRMGLFVRYASCEGYGMRFEKRASSVCNETAALHFRVISVKHTHALYVFHGTDEGEALQTLTQHGMQVDCMGNQDGPAEGNASPRTRQRRGIIPSSTQVRYIRIQVLHAFRSLKSI